MAERLDSLVLAAQEMAERYRLRFLYTDVIADGVKLICIAGAPISTGEDEEAGLRFATDLVAGDPLQRLHVGVNRGRVFAGFLGGQSRHTYTVMGDPVNLAARLMAKAEPGQVVAADEVVRRSRATFGLTPVAPFLVKGKQHPIGAHVVGAFTGEPPDPGELRAPARRAASRSWPSCTTAIASAGVGDGEVVEIVGDAGIGKSRLVEAVAEDPRLVVRIATECQPYDGLSPYAGVRPLLRRALGIPIAASRRRRRAPAARRRQRALAPATVPLLPLLAVALGAELPPDTGGGRGRRGVPHRSDARDRRQAADRGPAPDDAAGRRGHLLRRRRFAPAAPGARGRDRRAPVGARRDPAPRRCRVRRRRSGRPSSS